VRAGNLMWQRQTYLFPKPRSYLFVEVVFTAPYAGLESVRIGSAHLNNVRAKRFDVATARLQTLLEKACAMQIDIIGVDLNQGGEVVEAHEASPLQRAFSNLGWTGTAEPQMILGPGMHDDCVGFLIPPGSRLWQSCTLTKISYFCVLNNDIGLRRSDEGTHRPTVARFRIRGQENRRRRNLETEKARRQRSSRSRKDSRRQLAGRSNGSTSNDTSSCDAGEGDAASNTSPGLQLLHIKEVDSEEADLEDEVFESETSC